MCRSECSRTAGSSDLSFGTTALRPDNATSARMPDREFRRLRARAGRLPVRGRRSRWGGGRGRQTGRSAPWHRPFRSRSCWRRSSSSRPATCTSPSASRRSSGTTGGMRKLDSQGPRQRRHDRPDEVDHARTAASRSCRRRAGPTSPSSTSTATASASPSSSRRGTHRHGAAADPEPVPDVRADRHAGGHPVADHPARAACCWSPGRPGPARRPAWPA